MEEGREGEREGGGEGGRERWRWELVTINQRKEPRHGEVKILTPGKQKPISDCYVILGPENIPCHKTVTKSDTRALGPWLLHWTHLPGWRQ